VDVGATGTDAVADAVAVTGAAAAGAEGAAADDPLMRFHSDLFDDGDEGLTSFSGLRRPSTASRHCSADSVCCTHTHTHTHTHTQAKHDVQHGVGSG
jgi:hypothetical protein